MLAITYPMKGKRIKVAKWGTPKNIKKIKNKIDALLSKLGRGNSFFVNSG
jgi:hypothetical protein